VGSPVAFGFISCAGLQLPFGHHVLPSCALAAGLPPHPQQHICSSPAPVCRTRRDDGVGLAAPQVGVNVRLMVFNEAGEKGKGEEVRRAGGRAGGWVGGRLDGWVGGWQGSKMGWHALESY